MMMLYAIMRWGAAYSTCAEVGADTVVVLTSVFAVADFASPFTDMLLFW